MGGCGHRARLVAVDFVSAHLFLQWVWNPLGIVSVLVLGIGYAVGMVRAHRLGNDIAPARAFLWYVAGVLPLFVATGFGWQRVHDVTLLPTVLQQTALLQVVPAGLALGDPLGLLRAASTGAGRRRVESMLQSRPVRWLAYPLLTPALACGVMLAFVTSGWLNACATSTTTNQLTGALFLVIGLLFAVPMLADETTFLPEWCTPGIKVLIAAVDGLADSIPALLVMLASHLLWHPSPRVPLEQALSDQQSSGALMFCLAELVGLPVIIGAAVQWFTSDNRRARDLDAELDAAEAAGTLDLKQAWTATGTPDDADDERYQRPWWELNN